MTKKETAVTAFLNGQNCAQCIIAAYASDFQLSGTAALALASGFGGGMGRLQQTCGALTGSYMVLGLHAGSQSTDPKVLKELTPPLVRRLQTRFVSVHGTDQCRELTGVDFSTTDGHDRFVQFRMREAICQQCIETAVDTVEEILSE